MPAAPPSAPVRLLGLCGSLRRASTNLAILRAARELAPADVEMVLHPLHELPMYDGDLETEPLPAPVAALRQAATSVRLARAVEHVEDGELVTASHRDEVAALVAALAARVHERRRRHEAA